MYFTKVNRSLSLLALLLAVPALCLPAAIQVNGTTCELGNCASPGLLNPGDSIPLTNYSFIYVFANTDKFSVTGTYSASGASPSISFSAVASYLGNSSNTGSQGDVLSVDLLQNFGYNGSPDGTYTETATLFQTANVATGSSVTAQLFFSGKGIGLLGPYTGSSSQTFTKSTLLTGLSNPSLADFNYTFTLAAGSTPAVPEPGNSGLIAIGLTAIAVLRFRRFTVNRV